ncbi:hypothetical protein V1508DRAFT_434580 [Lipomyces doorenjongii]|uniref:uncharacterized protein n=1 Tax=Lipomyces doorenjongii TaxID=383834 RepID=UPI0034CF4D3C
MASNDDEQASYQRALNFLTANEPERRLDIYLSYKSFQFLEEMHAPFMLMQNILVSNTLLLIQELLYVRLQQLHSSSAVGLQICITESIRDILIQFDKKHLASRILPVGESKYSSVNDESERSTKTPDAGLKYDNGQLNELLIVVEAGVFESSRVRSTAQRSSGTMTVSKEELGLV